MQAMVLFFEVLGVCYVSWLLTNFLVWLDGADELETALEPDNEPIGMSAFSDHADKAA